MPTLVDRVKRALPLTPKKIVRYGWLRMLEAMGQRPSPSIFGLAEKLDPYLQPATRRGVFIEAGANDGVSQSNTYHLERYYGWSGVLVEPIPWLADLARNFRKGPVFQAALGSFEDEGSFITLSNRDLVSQPAESGIKVLVRALSSILDEAGVSTVDFFSLDVEGYENGVMAGVDFDRHRFENILVESSDISTFRFPWELYADPVKLTKHDYLFVRK